MKQKYVWFAFLISLFTLVPYRIYQRVVLGQNAGKIFGIGTNDLGIIATFIVFVLLIIIMTNLLKDSNVIKLKKNKLTGLLGLVSGLGVLISSFAELMHTIPLLIENKGQLTTNRGLTQHRENEVKEFINSQISVQTITIVAAVLGIVGFVGLVFLAMMSFYGESKYSKFRLISLFPTVWAVAYLIEIYIARTSLVAERVDLFDIISCALLMMFLFTQAKFFVKIKDPKLNKRLLQYGLLAVCSMLVYSIPSLANLISTGTLTPVVFWKHLSNIILALYITMFLLDLRSNVEEFIETNKEVSENEVEEQSVLEAQENEPAVDVEMFHVNDMIDKLEGIYT